MFVGSSDVSSLCFRVKFSLEYLFPGDVEPPQSELSYLLSTTVGLPVSVLYSLLRAS